MTPCHYPLCQPKQMSSEECVCSTNVSSSEVATLKSVINKRAKLNVNLSHNKWLVKKPASDTFQSREKMFESFVPINVISFCMEKNGF